jgi:hypothetical protein
VLDLAEINLSALLLEKISIEKRLRLDFSKPNYKVSKTNAELVIMLRRGCDTEAQCGVHSDLPGKFLDPETLTIKCDDCRRQHPRRGDLLPLVEGQASDLVRSRLEDKLRQFDSFNIPPLLLRDLRSSHVAPLLRIFKLLDSEKVFVAYCPQCLKRLTNATALRYPCGIVHLICKTCDLKDSVKKCCYDSQEYRRDTMHTVNLASLYTNSPVCPLCMVSKKLKVLQCDHSFCERCLCDLKKCPMCSKTIRTSLVDNLRPESFLMNVRPTGLQQQGDNYCFLSSAIQAIYHLTDLREVQTDLVKLRLRGTAREFLKVLDQMHSPTGKVFVDGLRTTLARSFKATDLFQARKYSNSYEAYSAIMQQMAQAEVTLVEKFRVLISQESKCDCVPWTSEDWSSDCFGLSVLVSGKNSFLDQLREDFQGKALSMCLGSNSCEHTEVRRKLLNVPEVLVFQLNFQAKRRKSKVVGSYLVETLNIRDILHEDNALEGYYQLKGAVFMLPGKLLLGVQDFKGMDDLQRLFGVNLQCQHPQRVRL